MRVFHWQTESYAQHKAFGKIYDSLDGLIDSFVETYMGVNGRSRPTVTFQIELKSLTGPEVVSGVIDMFIGYLKAMDQEDLTSDLLNIRDSILGEVHTLKYLLTLK